MNMTEDMTPALPTDQQTVAVSSETDTWCPPAFKVSGIFSSHMVLQREKPIKIWGFSDTPGSRVAGCFMGETVTATVGEDRRWMLTFYPRPYTTEPQILMISDDRDHTVTFEDILIGDVYLIGGQSNAELYLASCMTLTPSIEFDERDNFRLFTQTQAYPYTHQDLCAMPQPDIINPDWCWKRPDREASLNFSAMGWYFAHEATKHTDIPLGLVMMCAGGACLSELLPIELAHGEGYTAGGNVQEGGYYNTLIHPLEGLAFRAQLFFQGESEGGNRYRAERYDYELALLIADERARFGQSFPFYNVQLSDYREEGKSYFPYLDMIRVKQYDALALIPDSTLTVDMDLGAPEDHPDWAHSPRKMELGERLALLILAKEYGIGRMTECGSPRPVTAMLNPAHTAVTIEFTDVAAGLIVSGHNPADSYGMEVQGFSFGDYDHRTLAKATLSSRHSVTVDLPAAAAAVLTDPNAAPETVAEAKAQISRVNYAYFHRVTPETADLRGGNNLPAPAFSLPVMGL